jgi:hypothetical protein
VNFRKPVYKGAETDTLDCTFNNDKAMGNTAGPGLQTPDFGLDISFNSSFSLILYFTPFQDLFLIMILLNVNQIGFKIK